MTSIEQPPSSGHWRAVLVGLALLLGISGTSVGCWYLLDKYQQREYQHRFDLNVIALGEILEARMRAYEMVLRGVAAVFAGGRDEVSLAQWNEIVEQLHIQGLYPGISSVVWARHLRQDQLDDFIDNNYGDYHEIPEGARDQYLLIQFVEPLNAHTSAVLGLDLLTQPEQREPILKAIDNGRATLSKPIPDLYTLSPKPNQRLGFIMYFPSYKSAKAPDTLEKRRANLLSMSSAAFRGDELAEGTFASRLRLFHIVARDVEAGRQIFDTAHKQALNAPPGWKPQLTGQIDLPLYGRTWRLSVSSTPEYEQALIKRSQDLVLVMGFTTAVLLALLSAAFVWQRDRQLETSRSVESKLRKQAEQLMMANRYKSEFLANMSHELRTPLNSILILSDQLRQNSTRNLTDKQIRHSDIVHRAGNDLLSLINDVLDLAKVEAGRMQIALEPTNLQDLLVDLDASMRPLAEAKHLQLYIPSINTQNAVPQRVFTDQARLHQILRNLLSNAIKFTDHGQVQLMLSASEKRSDGSVLMSFTVRDTGIGIAPEKHKQVFEAFQQLDGSTSRRYDGTGLGLAITRQLVKALGGHIELQSALGQGSVFTVSLPMQPVDALSSGEIAPPKREGEGPPLLIVEDDVQFAAIIVEQALAHGFSSVHCSAGLQALELLKTETFAAIILDILLPDISGWQLFRTLRAMPAHQRTLVHIISCLPQPDRLDELETHYLTKPIEREVLEELFTGLKDDVQKSGAASLLLVEDIEAEREHYRTRLSELGFKVTAASNAQEALLAWIDQPFAVLVLDLNLPDQDGFTLLDNLNERRPVQGTQVIVNTGLDVSQEGLQRLSSYSAVVVHKKGDDSGRLSQAVQGFLAGIHTDTPQQNLSADKADKAPPAQDEPNDVLQGRRVLLVDDDVRNVYAMSALLDDLGLEVITASNGEEAVACFAQSALDLILMDMSMPVMDGYSATNLLKTEHGCTIPIIALTAHAMKGDREKCLAAGADDYLAKPVDRQTLRAMLELWLLNLPRTGN